MADRQVFISYPSKHRQTADAILGALTAVGIPCWMAPGSIPPGSDFAAAITKAIKNSRAMVLVFCAHTNESDHCQNEVGIAHDHGVTIVPFRIEEVQPNETLQYYLSKRQWLDAIGGNPEDHVQGLSETLRELISGADGNGEPVAGRPGETRGGGAGAEHDVAVEHGLDLADKPSIAVLPFDNMSRDPEQDYFADGITEDIITELSRYPDLFVIARNTTFTYKGKAVDVKKVGRDLGVRYIAKGSVRKSGNRVRITIQLIDAGDGSHLWAERFDRDLEDVFAVQDEITQMIVAALPRRLESAHLERAKRKLTGNMAAYDYLLRGKEHHYRGTKEDNAEARRMENKAIELDPGYAQAYAWRACSIAQAWYRGYFEGGGNDAKELIHEAARKAVSLDDGDAECHRVLSGVQLVRRRFDEAELHQERALALNPNDPRIVSAMGELQTWLGNPDEGVKWIEKAMRLDPTDAGRRAIHLGTAMFVAKHYPEAVKSFKRVPSPQFGQHAFLAACYAYMGDGDEAKAHASEVGSMKPDFTVDDFLESLPYKNESDREHHRGALRKAGLA